MGKRECTENGEQHPEQRKKVFHAGGIVTTRLLLVNQRPCRYPDSVYCELLPQEVTMPSAKEQIAKILQDQPDDSSYDEILREFALARMIERGLADSDAGRTISHEEMGRRIKTWRN